MRVAIFYSRKDGLKVMEMNGRIANPVEGQYPDEVVWGDIDNYDKSMVEHLIGLGLNLVPVEEYAQKDNTPQRIEQLAIFNLLSYSLKEMTPEENRVFWVVREQIFGIKLQ